MACKQSGHLDKEERDYFSQSLDDGASLWSDSDEEDYPEIVDRWVYLYDE
jgi:hypothetical protein